jgi:hypothetical protein
MKIACFGRRSMMRIMPALGLVPVFTLAIIVPAVADMTSYRLAITGRLEN